MGEKDYGGAGTSFIYHPSTPILSGINFIHDITNVERYHEFVPAEAKTNSSYGYYGIGGFSGSVVIKLVSTEGPVATTEI